MARKMRLSDANVAKLRLEGDEYTVWDTRIPGMGVRVRPSGYRAFVYHHTREGSSTRHTLGPVTLTRVEEAHRKCLELQVRTGSKKTERAAVTSPPPRFKDFVAGEWWKTCYERYKPSTRKGTDSALESQLLPTFGDLPLDRITPTDVNRWFDHYSATSPGAANYTLNLFRQIINQAIAREFIRTNPARGIKRNPRTKLTRFLSREEIRRLHEALDRCVAERPSRRPGADIIRLLLLTGCRRSEILNLSWQEVAGDVLELKDTKTGPRRVLLNTAARVIITRQPRTASPHVFPSPLDPSRPRSGQVCLWGLVRKQAGIEDVRLHDLRHTYASQAVMRGVPLPMVARLLGHSQVQMTLRYAHTHDKEVEAAAERIGKVITGICDSSGS